MCQEITDEESNFAVRIEGAVAARTQSQTATTCMITSVSAGATVVQR